ncbi:hypothetical protein E1A91_A10G118200v1 [Gossypium mustelinum]|uniref:F-box associated domain-containing protein n=1 Tax=Gossypium mustelinum TaxID=34275 RepID=A0A5D2XKI9_GOSMU|nr:hypothetical protein E1A91_A10G118200v1 [Gossypium mustelinum]
MNYFPSIGRASRHINHRRLHLSHIYADGASEFITIQPPYKERCRSRFWGPCYSIFTNQYKLLQSSYPTILSNYPMDKIYTIGSGIWRSIGNAPTDLELYKVFTEYITTRVLGDFLFICYFPDFVQFDIWVMEEYGVKESWTKQFVIKDMYPKGYGWDIYQPMVVLSNGEIFMLLNNEEISCYNQKRRHMRGAKSFQIRSQFNAIAYTPCFVSLYNVAKGEQISRYYVIILKLTYASSSESLDFKSQILFSFFSGMEYSCICFGIKCAQTRNESFSVRFYLVPWCYSRFHGTELY